MSALINGLMQPDAYPHPVSDVRVLETHISWVLLSGDYAYKIKKPVSLGFLDFSTLELRKRFCDEELRLNQRWAPSLYLEVVAICGSPTAPVVGGDGKVIEYALKMRQFAQSRRLDAQLDAGLVTDKDMSQLAATIAGQHSRVPVMQAQSDAAAFASVSEPMLDNFSYLQGRVDDQVHQQLRQWTNHSLCELRQVLVERQHAGFVRECHGDLHLANLVRLDQGIRAFDCIEFSADLRRIDVVSDIAFLVMDLAARGRHDLGFLFLNRYLELTGDYAGMTVFSVYFVYHCLIRAKVAAIRASERGESTEATNDREDAAHYCRVALRWIAPRTPQVVAMHGFSGSGKTWLSGGLMAVLPAIRLRSDIERKREHDLAETQSSHSAAGSGLYSGSARSGIYQRLFTLAAGIVGSGYNVILDASFLNASDRAHALALAASLGAGFAIVTAEADHGEVARRLRERTTDASEADATVVLWQRQNADPLSAQEAEKNVVVATDRAFSASRVAELIAQIS